MIPIMMHLHCISDTSAAHWHDTVKVSQRTYDRQGAREGPHCSSTGNLSHRCMFHNWASVLHHIAATKPCGEANMGILEILLEARAGDVVAGGPRRTSDISQQVTCRQKSETIY